MNAAGAAGILGAVTLALAAAPAGRTTATGGAGAGTYASTFGCGGVLRAPYQEASLSLRHETGPVTAGLTVAARDDDEDEAEVVEADDNANEPAPLRSGTRWLVSPSVGYRWRFLRGRVGVHGGTYYSVKSNQDTKYLLPRLALGVGGDGWFLEGGVLDPPEGLPPFTANGGLGLATLRLGLSPAKGHLAMATFGGSEAEPFVAVSYLGQMKSGLVLGGGAFAGQYGAGGMLVLGVAVER